MTEFDDMPASDDVATDADGGTFELALRLIPPEVWQHHYALMKVMADPKTAKRVLRSVHDSLVAAAQRDAELDAREAAVAAREAAAAEHEKANTAEAVNLHEQKV